MMLEWDSKKMPFAGFTSFGNGIIIVFWAELPKPMVMQIRTFRIDFICL